MFSQRPRDCHFFLFSNGNLHTGHILLCFAFREARASLRLLEDVDLITKGCASYSASDIDAL